MRFLRPGRTGTCNRAHPGPSRLGFKTGANRRLKPLSARKASTLRRLAKGFTSAVPSLEVKFRRDMTLAAKRLRPDRPGRAGRHPRI